MKDENNNSFPEAPMPESQPDIKQEAHSEPVKKEKKPRGKIRRFFHAWWDNKAARWGTIVTVLLLIVGLASYPRTRYFMLNTAGVRSSVSITVVDNNTQQPLKNVQVQVNNASGKTDDNGYVKLQDVKLGNTTLTVERKAFEPLTTPVTIGWGSNPLGQVVLQPKGLQYSFLIKDFLSGKPIEKAEATSGDSSAFSDKDGKLVLTLETTSEEPVEITINADSYRTEKLTETAENNESKEINMVPAQQQAFISKRSGKYDLYKIYADGKGESLVLSGTGSERDDLALVAQPTGNLVALVSTRDNQRSPDGTLLSTLNVVNLSNDSVTEVVSGRSIKVIGWTDNTVVYVVTTDETTDSGAKKQTLASYDFDKDQKLNITSASYFNSVMLVNGSIYYAPAREAQSDEGVGLFVSAPSGVGATKLLDKETWSMSRTDYDTLTLTTGSNWYEVKLANNQVNPINGAPANGANRIYVNNSDSSRSLWIDNRDGKGVLLNYNLGNQQDVVLVSQSGLAYPARWLNNTTAVYRVTNNQETADYVVSTEGGEPKKIVDVTNSAGLENWYYY